MRIFIVFLVFISTACLSTLLSADNQNLYKKLDVFGDVFDIIKKNYVEEVHDEKVIEYAIKSPISTLELVLLSVHEYVLIIFILGSPATKVCV